MELSLNRKGNILIVSIEGEIDHHTSETIRSKVDASLTSAGIRNVIFDFSKVSFMDSSGIGMLMGRYKNILRMGGKVWIASVNDTVKRILDMSGVLRLIPAMSNVDEIVKSIL